MYPSQSNSIFTSGRFYSMGFYCLIGSACLLIAGCSRYSVSVNDRSIYTPPTVIQESLISDARLSACVQQAIEDQIVRQPTDLKRLDCDYAGISSLEGLSGYSRIEQLSLSHNNITNIDELLRLTYLREVDLSENPELVCENLASLRSSGAERIYSNLECD